MSRTTISVDAETRDELYYKKQPGESYDEFLRRVFVESDDAPDRMTEQ